MSHQVPECTRVDSVALQLAALTDAGRGSEGDSVQVAHGEDRAGGSGWEPTHLLAPQLSGGEGWWEIKTPGSHLR